MSAHDVVAEIVPLIETTASERDETLARPVQYTPGILYGWPVRDDHVPEGDGSLDRVDMTLRLAWCVDAEPEVAAMGRDRATTDTLRTQVAAIATWVRDHRKGSSYESLRITAVDWEAINPTLSSRGALIELSAYLLVTS